MPTTLHADIYDIYWRHITFPRSLNAGLFIARQRETHGSDHPPENTMHYLRYRKVEVMKLP
jgi:hypothetical protein